MIKYKGFTPPVSTATVPAEVLDEGDVLIREGQELEVLKVEIKSGAVVHVQLRDANRTESCLKFEPTECVTIKWHTLTGNVVPTAPCYRERDILGDE
jgi:hypothetical protein